MNITVKQISSLEKVRLQNQEDYTETFSKTVFGGERFSYQIAIHSTGPSNLIKIGVESPLRDYIKLYNVKNSVMDMPTYADCEDEDYITKEPGLMPDLLSPIENSSNYHKLQSELWGSVWVRIDVPEDFPAGVYDIKITFEVRDLANQELPPYVCAEKSMSVEVLGKNLPPQKLIYTQWFHADCIADEYEAEIYSDKHWELIDKYMHTARETGVNMLLMPVITPPLDTMYGTTRPCVQLVDIEKDGNEYRFNFDKVKKWINLCKKNGIEYYEISHLFSQWGSKYAPNILATVAGRQEYIFGWHVPSLSDEYIDFLVCFIPKLVELLRAENIDSKAYFHVSDEPSLKNIDAYRRAQSVLKPLLGNAKIFDALSNIDFYKEGLVECPVTATNHIDEFLKLDIPDQWAYTCCGQYQKVGNRFLAMPSYRNRVLGLQLYKYGIQGFLQWGFNYYNGVISSYKLNPYTATSGDMSYPSGDAFSVYPGKSGPLLSLRALVFYEGIQDIAVCSLLESFIGRDEVVKMIEEDAEMNLTFDDYPKTPEYLLTLREKMTARIKNLLAQKYNTI